MQEDTDRKTIMDRKLYLIREKDGVKSLFLTFWERKIEAVIVKIAAHDPPKTGR